MTAVVYIVVMPLIVELLHSDAQPPRRATEGSAGYDLCAYLRGRAIKCSDGQRTWDALVASNELDRELGSDSISSEMESDPNSRHTNSECRFVLPSGVTALVPLGFKARMPDGVEAQIRPRSGTTFKKGVQIPNAPGTIDSDYPDEWMVIVRNPTEHPIHIAHGERIAQMVLARYEVLEVETGSVSVTTTRVGGFGSTGR